MHICYKAIVVRFMLLVLLMLLGTDSQQVTSSAMVLLVLLMVLLAVQMDFLRPSDSKRQSRKVIRLQRVLASVMWK